MRIYSVQFLSRLRVLAPVSLLLLAACSSGGGGDSGTTPPPASYSVGGTVGGLTGTGLVLQNNGVDDLAITASGAFTFTTKITSGAAYAVTVKTQPVNQLCTVSNGTGTISANVTNVSVACVATFAVGGYINSAAAACDAQVCGGPTLLNNGSDALAIDTIPGPTLPASFTFATRIPTGGSYDVTQLVRASAPSQDCTVTSGGTGTVGSTDVNTVVVDCMPYSANPKLALVAKRSANSVDSYVIGGAGALTAGGTIATGDQPIAVAATPGGTHAYVVNNGTGNISAYSVNSTSGAFTPLAGSPYTTVNLPMSIAIHPSGKFAFVAGLANTIQGQIAAYSIDAISGVLSVIDLDPGTGTTLATGKDPYEISIDPSGRFVYVANYTADTVSAYTVDQATGVLTSVGTVASAAGAGPISVAIDPLGNCALVANNKDNTVSAYSINQTSGALTAVGTPLAAGTAPRSVAFDPNGTYAYVANAGDGVAASDVSGYSFDPASCVFTQIDLAPADTATLNIAAGITPISISVDPSGQYVYVANTASANVSVYTTDPSGVSGALTAGTPVSTGTGPSSVTVMSQ